MYFDFRSDYPLLSQVRRYSLFYRSFLSYIMKYLSLFRENITFTFAVSFLFSRAISSAQRSRAPPRLTVRVRAAVIRNRLITNRMPGIRREILFHRSEFQISRRPQPLARPSDQLPSRFQRDAQKHFRRHGMERARSRLNPV